METEVKKEWKTPELIVLVRSKPEEAVLTACKTSSAGGTGPSATLFGCRVPTTCLECSTVVGS
jgi:hypothetical protein